MFKTKIIIATFLLLGALVAAALGVNKSYSFTPPPYDITGTWISNQDPLWKITFTASGERKDYYENLLTDLSTYYITNTCGSQTSSNDSFLKTVDNENNVTCDILNGTYTDENGITTLSITSENGKLYLFTKQ